MSSSFQHFTDPEFILDLKNCCALNNSISQSRCPADMMTQLDRSSNSLHRISISHEDRHLFAFATSAPYQKTEDGLVHPHTDASWAESVSSFFTSWQNDPETLAPSLPSSTSSDSLVETVYVCFQGTQTAQHLRTDLLAFQTPPFQDGITGKVHYGFWKIAQDIPVHFFASFLIHSPNSRIVFTGHSLGAAVALLVALRLLKGFQDPYSPNPESERVSCLLFGLPPVGDSELMATIATVLPVQNLVVFVHVKDIVPRLVFALGHLLSTSTGKKSQIKRAACSLLSCLTKSEILPNANNLLLFLLNELSRLVQAQLDSYDVYGSYYFLKVKIEIDPVDPKVDLYIPRIPALPIVNSRKIFRKLVVKDPPKLAAISIQAHLFSSYFGFCRPKLISSPKIPRAKLPLVLIPHFRLHKRDWRVHPDKTIIIDCPQYSTLKFALEAVDLEGNGFSWGLSIVSTVQLWDFPPVSPSLGSTDKELILELQIPKVFKLPSILTFGISTVFAGVPSQMQIPMVYGSIETLRTPKKLRDIEAFPRLIIQKTFMTALYHPTGSSRKTALSLLEQLDNITTVKDSSVLKQVEDLCGKTEFFKVLFAGMSDKEMRDLEEKFAPLVNSTLATPDEEAQSFTAHSLVQRAEPALEATYLTCSQPCQVPSSSSSIPLESTPSSPMIRSLPSFRRCTLAEAIQFFEEKSLNSSESILSAGHIIVRMNLVISDTLEFRKAWYHEALPQIGYAIGGIFIAVGVFWGVGLAVGVVLGLLAEVSFGAALITGGIGTLGALLGAIAEGVFADIINTSNLYFLNLTRLAKCLRVAHENSSVPLIEENILTALSNRHGIRSIQDFIELEIEHLQATDVAQFINFAKVRRFLLAVRILRQMRKLVGEEYRIGILGSMKTGKSTLLARLGFPTNPSATVHTGDTMALSFPCTPNLIFYDFPGSDDIDPRTIASFQSWNRMIDFLIVVTELDKSDNQYLQSLMHLLVPTSRPLYILFNKADLASVDTAKHVLLTQDEMQKLMTFHLINLIGDQVKFNQLTTEDPKLLHYDLTCFDNQFFRAGYTRQHSNSCGILNAPQTFEQILQHITVTDEIQIEQEILNKMTQIVTDSDAQAETKASEIFQISTAGPSSSTPVTPWSLKDWLTTLQMPQYIELFQVNGFTMIRRLKALTEERLKTDLKITNYGDRLDLIEEIKKLA